MTAPEPAVGRDLLVTGPLVTDLRELRSGGALLRQLKAGRR
ncbi:hypothetical protein ACFZC6_28175 [Streptomyces ossamyceticus]|uniref:Uncharacterized protein n=1 Tax=Streptomyces ossamyceticus TaxID=249581 RepID=A0ABV2UW07_9ACTN